MPPLQRRRRPPMLAVARNNFFAAYGAAVGVGWDSGVDMAKAVYLSADTHSARGESLKG